MVVVGLSASEIQCEVKVLEFGSGLESRLQGQVTKLRGEGGEGEEIRGGRGKEGKKQDTRSGKRQQASRTQGPEDPKHH